MKGEGERIPGTVKGLAAVSFWNDVASEMVFPLLPAFVTGTLGGSATILAGIEGAADVAASILKWFSGVLSDRPGWRKPLILIGYATAILVRPVNALASAAWQVVGVRVVDRVGKGLRTAPRDALIASVTPPPLHGRAFGLHRAFDHVGAVAGSVVAWWLLSRGMSLREVIGSSVIPGIVALLTVWVVLARVRQPEVKPEPRHEETATAPSQPLTLALGLLAFILLVRIPEVLLLLRVQQLGVAVPVIPLVWGALHVVRSVISYPGGWLSDRIGPRLTVAAGALFFSAVAVLLSRPLAVPMAIGTFLAFGCVAGLTESAERALVARLSPRKLGRGFGAYNAITGLAALPAALVFGWIYQVHGAPMALMFSAALSIVAAIAWMVAGRPRVLGAAVLLVVMMAAPGQAQVQVRLEDSERATYSELNEGLRIGTPAADTIARIQALTNPALLWKKAAQALKGTIPWNEGLLALTRLAELRKPAYADSAALLAQRIVDGEVSGPPGIDPGDLIEPLRAVQLMVERAKVGDAAMRDRIIAAVPEGHYGLADAWVLGRLEAHVADTLMARFSAAGDENLKVRYLTLLSFSDDPVAIPFLAAIYAAPDSAGIPPRAATRASDALLWIGTKESLAALKSAREKAREGKIYDDPTLMRGGYSFLDNDSSAVISRTGRWLDDWIGQR